MGPVAEYIKSKYNLYKKHISHIDPWMDEGDVCDVNPFFDEYWIHWYILPEMFQVYDEELKSEYDWFMNRGSMPDRYRDIDEFATIYIVYPCYFIPESEVLRLMAEIGIL